MIAKLGKKLKALLLEVQNDNSFLLYLVISYLLYEVVVY
jgi:hypothetical protein